MQKKKQKKVDVEEETIDESDEISAEDKTHDYNVPKGPEEIGEEMEEGKEEADVYGEGKQKLLDDDEIEDWEEGFMEGADSAGQLGKDALTGEVLTDVEDVVETEISGKVYRFVSKANAKRFREKLAKEKKQGRKK